MKRNLFFILLSIFLILSCSKEDRVIIFKNVGDGNIKIKYIRGEDIKEGEATSSQDFRVVIPYKEIKKDNEWNIKWEATFPDKTITRRFIDLKQEKNNPIIVELKNQEKY